MADVLIKFRYGKIQKQALFFTIISGTRTQNIPNLKCLSATHTDPVNAAQYI